MPLRKNCPGKPNQLIKNGVGIIEIGIGIGIQIEIARGSTFEYAAIQDVLVVGKALAETESQERKVALDRIAAMLSRLGGRGYCVNEDPSAYGFEGIDFDTDPEETKSKHQADAPDTHS